MADSTGVGPVQALRKQFGLVKTDNLQAQSQAAVAIHIKSKGKKRITHINAVVGDTAGTVSTLKAKVLVFTGGIYKEESSDTLSAFHTLEPQNLQTLLFECGLPVGSLSWQKEHYFINEDILEVADGEELCIVLLARADGPIWLRLFVNGCITTVE